MKPTSVFCLCGFLHIRKMNNTYHYKCSRADTVDFWLARPPSPACCRCRMHFIPQSPGKTAVLLFLPLVAALHPVMASLSTKNVFTTFVLLLLLIWALNFVQLYNHSNFVSGLSTASCWYSILLASSSTRSGIVNTTQHMIKLELLFIFWSNLANFVSLS